MSQILLEWLSAKFPKIEKQPISPLARLHPRAHADPDLIHSAEQEKYLENMKKRGRVA